MISHDRSDHTGEFLSVFDRISNDILSEADISGVFRVFAEEIVRSGVFRSLVVVLVDRDREVARIVEAVVRIGHGASTIGRKQRVIGIEYPLDDRNITAEVARTGRMETVVGWDDRYDATVTPPEEVDGKAAFFIPILGKDEVLAAIETGCAVAEIDAARARIEAMQPLLSHVAVAISHAQLIARLESSKARIQHERDRIRRYIDLSQTLFFVLDREGKVQLANRKGCEYLGMTETELVGRNAIDLVFPSDRRKGLKEALDRFVASSSETAGSVSFESELRIPTGELRRIHWHVTAAFDEHGEVVELVGSGDDVTEEQLLEDQLRQSQKMEAVGTLAGGIAHDFNNILSVIIGHSELLADSPALPGDLQESVHDIGLAAEKAGLLVHKLLAFSRKQILSFEAVDMNRVVESAVSLLKPIIGDLIELNLELTEQLPLIIADESQLEHVVVNLAVNARDAMPGGGSLTLATRVETIDRHPEYRWLEPGEYVVLEARDSGVGIPAEKLPHIFEPFYTTKPVGKGSGLGLSMVYGIVKQSGGYVLAESTPGEGASFELYFPVDHYSSAGG